MKSLTSIKIVLFIIFSFFTTSLLAQVKIGGTPKENPHPSAILDLQGTDRGFLMPRLTQQQMLAVKEPANALIIYNTDAKGMYIFSADQKQWLPLLQQTSMLEGESCEWAFDTTTLKVFLVRGYPLGDSIYYNTARKKFVFTDKPTLGDTNIPVDVQFPGKFIVKGTASRIFNDSASLSFPSLTLSNFLFEVDNDSFAVANPGLAFYNGMRVSTQLLPTATQKASTIRSLLLQVNHTGSDSLGAVTALASNAFVDGIGKTGTFNGFQNNMSVSESATGNIGTITGYRNNITMAGSGGSRVTGNVFGYFGSLSGFADSVGTKLVDGNAYGIFLNNVAIANPKKNYAFYSNKGHNRFADSTLITDGFFTSPRAVLDINSTSAMITPAGTTSQRPALPVTAMLRHNNDYANMEYYNGSTWKALSSDSAEWKFDAVTNRVNLVRGLPVNDTVFYNKQTRKFVFSDRYTNTNSLGSDFPVDAFNGKYTFKSTASQRTDSTLQDGAGVIMVYEVDESTGTSFPGLNVATVANPKRLSPFGSLLGISNNTIHAGKDSAQSVIGILSNTTANGDGFTEQITGLSNATRLNNLSTNSAGTMIGIQNSISRSPTATGRITGNAYGYFGTTSITANTVDGNVYGVFLNNVSGAAPQKNFAFYSSKGLNRFADSTLITDQLFTNPRAILDVNSTSAMITPAGTTAQRPGAPVTAMLRHNNDNANMEYYNGTAWKALSADSAEWKFDAATNRVNLVRGLSKQDTIFYDSQSRQFVFADRNTNTNSLGSDFPVQAFGAKYTFKTTASQRDSFQFDGANTNIVYEVDNTTSSTVYNALSTSTVMNPKAFQKADQLSGITNTIIHAGNDSVQLLIGIANTTRNSGNGKSGSITGIQNLVRIQNGSGNNTGEMVGFRNTMTRGGATAGRITGNVYGWLGSFSGFANNVDGTMYGIFINSVTGAGPRKNYAYYSNKGLNRLGDSLLVTDGSSITPRAVLDINATSAMIVPTGTTAQRPATAVTGMVRYNTQNGGRLETYNGAAWSGIISGGIGIDPPNIPVNSGVTVSFAFTGATVGSVVAVSPSSALPNGIIIAWARVSAANTIEIRFENNAGAAINPPSIGYNLRIIQ